MTTKHSVIIKRAICLTVVLAALIVGGWGCAPSHALGCGNFDIPGWKCADGASAKSRARKAQAERPPLGCDAELSDDDVKNEFRLWLADGLLAELTPEKLTAATHDTVRCRLHMEDDCDPRDPDGDHVVTIAWKREARELVGLTFDILKDKLASVLDSGRAFEIVVERLDPGEIEEMAGFEKYFDRCGGAKPAAYPAVSLILTDTLGECRRHNVFAFIRTAEAYKLMGVHITNNDDFIVAMYKSGSADLYLARGALCQDKGDYACAAKMYDKVISMGAPEVPASKLATAYTLRGDVFYGKEDYASAAADWGEAIALEPGNAEVYVFRAVAYQLMGEFEKAAEDAERSIRLDELDNAMAYNTRANARVEMGQYETAMEDYYDASNMENDPGLDEALLYNRSLLYAYMGDRPKADSLYRELAQLRRGAPRGVDHDYPDDIKQYNRYIERHPENALLRYHRGVVYDLMGEHEKARADFEAALRLNPEHELAKRYLGVPETETAAEAEPEE